MMYLISLSRMRIADDSFTYSDFKSDLPTDAVDAADIPVGSLRRLQNASGYSRMQRGLSSSLLSSMTEPLLQRNVTRSHLEHQIAAAEVLQSEEEYLYWLQAYIRFLVQDEDVPRLEELCALFLGPYHAASKDVQPRVVPTYDQQESQQQLSSAWSCRVLSRLKRDVLRSHILPTIASNRGLQRLVTKYQSMLRSIDEREQAQEQLDA